MFWKPQSLGWANGYLQWPIVFKSDNFWRFYSDFWKENNDISTVFIVVPINNLKRSIFFFLWQDFVIFQTPRFFEFMKFLMAENGRGEKWFIILHNRIPNSGLKKMDFCIVETKLFVFKYSVRGHSKITWTVKGELAKWPFYNISLI